MLFIHLMDEIVDINLYAPVNRVNHIEFTNYTNKSSRTANQKEFFSFYCFCFFLFADDFQKLREFIKNLLTFVGFCVRENGLLLKCTFDCLAKFGHLCRNL